MTSLAPLKTHVQSLKQLAAKSISLLSIVSQRAQLAKDIKQLQDDVARHSRDISQVQSTAVTLEQQVQGLGAISTGVKGLIERFESAKVSLRKFVQYEISDALPHPRKQLMAFACWASKLRNWPLR